MANPAEVVVRCETPDDRAAIHALVFRAFEEEAVADLVDRIRASGNYVPELALVAERAAELVGHIMLSYLDVKHGETTHRALTLSPVSVLPEAQGQGIGTALIEAAVEKADARGEPLIILEGSPAYYPRFGFRPAREFGISIKLPEGAPEDAAMVRPLSRYRQDLRGEVVYPPAFDLVNEDRD